MRGKNTRELQYCERTERRDDENFVETKLWFKKVRELNCVLKAYSGIIISFWCFLRPLKWERYRYGVTNKHTEGVVVFHSSTVFQ